MRLHFTKAALNALPCPEKGRQYHSDIDASGLVVACHASGAKSFYLYKWFKGRPRRIFIGPYPQTGIFVARKRARELAAEISLGRDPMEQRRRERAEITLGALFDLYLAQAKLRKKSWRLDEWNYKNHLAKWAGRKLSDIERVDVVALHGQIGKEAPVAANHVLSLLSVVFRDAKDLCGYDGQNPARGIKRFRETSRERFLLPAELPAFMEALKTEEDKRFRDFVGCLLFTAARRGAVGKMRWADLDLVRAIWTIPARDQKSGKSQVVALVPFVVEILVRRRQEADGEYVFGVRGRPYLDHAKKPWTAFVKRAGLKDLHMHDMRRTLGSWAAAGGVSLPIISKALGHTSLQSTQVYARLQLDPVREAVEKTANAILLAAKEKPKLNDGQ